jgi:hypothetical protein
MLRNFCLKFGLFVLIGFCTHCKTPSLPPEPIDKEDTTGTDTSHIDTSIISKPDTTHISDTVRARTSDSSLAYRDGLVLSLFSVKMIWKARPGSITKPMILSEGPSI